MLDKLDEQDLYIQHHTDGPENNLELALQTTRSPKLLQLDSNDLVTVQIDGVLFRISADILRLCSAIEEPIPENPGHQRVWDPDPLIMSGITATRFSCFLTVAKARTFWSQFSLSLEDWISTLHAATQLGCDVIRTLAINSMNKGVQALKPVPIVLLGLRYRVSKWAEQGFTRLIEREQPLSYEEGNALGMRRALAISRSRESLARNQHDNGRLTADVINGEPDLKNPAYEEIDEIQFQESPDPLPVSKHPLHYESNFVDLVAEDSLWRVSMATLGDTSYLRERVEQQKSSEDKEWPIVDLSGEVGKVELESYLSVVNARRFDHSSGQSLGLTFQQWVGMLRSATVFGHTDARRFAISFLERQLMDQDPFDVIDAAKTCNVDHWLQPQYVRIAGRQNFPSEEEGRRLGVTSLLAVCQLREQSAYNKMKEFEATAQAYRNAYNSAQAPPKDKKRK